jgi:hypothetical protein
MARLGLVCLALGWLTIRVSADQTGVESLGKKSLHAFLAATKGGKRTTTFSADVPEIYVVWKGEGFQVGDTIQITWIAEDVGGRILARAPGRQGLAGWQVSSGTRYQRLDRRGRKVHRKAGCNHRNELGVELFNVTGLR